MFSDFRRRGTGRTAGRQGNRAKTVSTQNHHRFPGTRGGGIGAGRTEVDVPGRAYRMGGQLGQHLRSAGVRPGVPVRPVA